MRPLETLIALLMHGRLCHVCIHDVSGMLARRGQKLPRKFCVHSLRFCDLAKSSDGGYRTCLAHKTECLQSAPRESSPYLKTCPWGLSEIALPIVRNGETEAMLYVGPCVSDLGEARAALFQSAEQTGNENSEAMLALLESYAEAGDRETLTALAEIIRDYLLALPEKACVHEHWPVSELKRVLQTDFSKQLTLTSLAALYGKNEKYLGRLFLAETGMTFKQYLTEIRLKHARDLLLVSGASILDIALDCGFGSVSYFNRLFRQRYQMTPSEYRKRGDRRAPR